MSLIAIRLKKKELEDSKTNENDPQVTPTRREDRVGDRETRGRGFDREKPMGVFVGANRGKGSRVPIFAPDIGSLKKGVWETRCCHKRAGHGDKAISPQVGGGGKRLEKKVLGKVNRNFQGPETQNQGERYWPEGRGG